MADPTITDAVKQVLITRLATIKSATSILSLLNGVPAKVTVDEVLDLAEHVERWAWRDLRGDHADNQTREKPVLSKSEGSTDPSRPTSPEKKEPQPSLRKDDQPRLNGGGQRMGEASEKQINAIFAIGRSKGFNSNDLKAEIREKLGKSVMQLTSREASKLIDDLRAL